MYLKVAKSITLLVVLVMSFQILGASITAFPSTSEHTFTVHPQKSLSSFVGTFLFEKTEEKNNEVEKDGMQRVILADFSRIAFSLSYYHNPQIPVPGLAVHYDVRPAVHERYCVFLI